MNPHLDTYDHPTIGCGTRAEWARDRRAMIANDRANEREDARLAWRMRTACQLGIVGSCFATAMRFYV